MSPGERALNLEPERGQVPVDASAEVECAVSAIVFTLNEELNLEHCLNSLKWCDDVVVVDSFSTDRTMDICANHGLRAVQHEFEGFGGQRNWALNQIRLKHEWVLILDADERVPPSLADELNRVARQTPEKFSAYRLRRRFFLWGRWLRFSSLYPTWVVRFLRLGKVRYANRGHSETQEVDGGIGELRGYLIDENHKPLEAWFERQSRYAYQEAMFELLNEDSTRLLGELFAPDPMRRRAGLKRLASRLPFRGLSYFLYCYVMRFGFLDGRDGYVFCRMKAMYQSMIAVYKHGIAKKRIEIERAARNGGNG